MLLTFKIIFWTGALGVAYSYVIYPLLLQILSAGRNTPTPDSGDTLPSVSVIVPVYNEEAVISRKIRNLLDLEYPPEKLTVMIGSDCSSDNTHRIVREMDDPRVRLWISSSRIGKTGILNHLAPQVTSDVILFTDANTMHDRDSLRTMVRHYADPRVGGVAGDIQHLVNRGNGFGETVYRRFESRQKLLESRLHSTISAYGGFYSIRSSLFRPIPPNSYSNDDVLIPMDVIRQKRRMIFEPRAVSSEDFTADMRSEFFRRVRIGAGNFQSFSWLLDFLNPLRGWPAFCYVSHKVSRWFSPVMLLSVLISSAVLALAAGGIYTVVLAAAGAVVLSGLVALIVPRSPSARILYFLMMNAALLLGFVRFAAGIRSAAWSRTQRGEGPARGGSSIA